MTMNRHERWALAALGVALAMTMASQAGAEPLPDSLVTQSKASSGNTDVATSGFERVQKSDADSKDATELQVAAGGLAASGNSRSLAATTSSKFRLRRAENQVSLAAAANYARSASAKSNGLTTTVENVQGKARYDRFVAGSFALFGGASVLHDRFRGLNLRLNLDPGVSYFYIDESSSQLWSEVGYDYQHDIRSREEIATAVTNRIALRRTESRSSARVFVGYSNAVSKTVTFASGIEYIQSLGRSKNYRLNWDGSVNSAVGKGFSIATSVSVRYDHNPLPDVEKTDVVTSLSLVYQLL